MGMQGQPPLGMPAHAMGLGPQQVGAEAYTMGPAFDPYDPMLDADPFGLTASMHFPTQFTFQESSMRR